VGSGGGQEKKKKKRRGEERERERENAGVYFAQIFYLCLGCSKYAASSRKTNVRRNDPSLAYFLAFCICNGNVKKEIDKKITIPSIKINVHLRKNCTRPFYILYLMDVCKIRKFAFRKKRSSEIRSTDSRRE